MKRGWKRILKRGGLVLAGLLFLLAVFSAFIYFHKPTLKAYLERTLSKRPGLTVEIGRLDYRLFPLRVEADSVRIGFTSLLGRAEAFVEHAAAPGSLRRVLKNQYPFFDVVTLSGLKFAFFEDPDAPPAGMIDVIAAARTSSEFLRSVGKLIIRDADLRLDLPVEGVYLRATGLDLEAVRADRTTIDLSAKNFDFKNSRPGAGLTTGLRARLTWDSSDTSAVEADLDLTRASLSLPESGWSGDFPALGAGLHYDGRRLAVSRLRTEIPGFVKLAGSGWIDIGRGPGFSFASRIEVLDIERAKKEFASFLPGGLPEFSFAGSALWEGEVRRDTNASSPAILLDGALRIPPARLSMKRDGFDVDLTIQADLRVGGTPADLRVDGIVKGERGELAGTSLQIRELAFNLPVHSVGSRMTVSPFKARAAELVMNRGASGLKLAGVAAGGGLKIDFAGREATLDSLDLDLPRIGRLSLGGRVSFAARPDISLNLSSRALDFHDLLGTFGAFVPPAVVAWQPSGRADLSIEVRSAPPPERRFRVQGVIAIAGAAFQDSAGDIISEGLEPRLSFQANIGKLGQPLPLSFRLELAKGESLWKALYLNWRDNAFRLDVAGELDPAAKSFRGATATLAFAPLGELRAVGSLSTAPALRVETRLSAPSVDLARLQGFLAKAMPSTKSAAWEVAGLAEAEADAHFDRAFRIHGTLKIREGSLGRAGGGLSLAGVSADLPFSLSNGVRPGDEQGDYAFDPGFLAVREIRSSILPLGPLRIDFVAARNLFLFPPFEIGLWGARLGTGLSVLALCPAIHSWRGVSSVTLDGLELAALPIASEAFKHAGRVWIPQSGLAIRPDEIRFKGQILGDFFGGGLTLDGLRITDPFSAERRVMFQAAIPGLDLGRVTSAVPFGDITGIVDVSLRDVAISYGQPESFSLGILSVPRKGVSRKFSLKAVDNLSVISSGGRATPPSASWLMKFVSGFNYSRIGIACSLRNDVFTLQGTIIEGGVQYLVRRSTFFGIDVVNAKPVNTISFKDMIGRLERVGGEPPKK